MFQNGEAGWHRFLPQSQEGDVGSLFAAAHSACSVLITGAGGSIGSALAQALARAGVRRLVLLDSSEARLNGIQRRLAQTPAPVEMALGSIDDAGFVDTLLSRHRVDVVYHAAAWKHVPQLESNPFSAVRNNALGTFTLAQSALRAGVPSVTLISTDKAVNPLSIMGASKRIAELAVTSLSDPACRMNAVRLCNVIGSSGSVVPIFLEQIGRRQPLSVTDPRASRWFLTTQEAVGAILGCGVSGQHGKILLPPVGLPVRIAELAEFLIRSAGSAAEISYIGLRPGEKLTEELVFESEREVGTVGSLRVLETSRLDRGELTGLFADLGSSIQLSDLSGLLRAVGRAIPEYVPSSQLLGQVVAAAGATA